MEYVAFLSFCVITRYGPVCPEDQKQRTKIPVQPIDAVTPCTIGVLNEIVRECDMRRHAAPSTSQRRKQTPFWANGRVRRPSAYPHIPRVTRDNLPVGLSDSCRLSRISRPPLIVTVNRPSVRSV